jgi:Rhodanese-related sulfurtransferase
MKKLLLTLAAALVAGNLFAADFEEISMAELQEHIDKGTVTVVDVNGTESYKAGHIPGAIDFVAVKEDFASKLPAEKDALIVAYCGSPQCGAWAQAATAAKELGYTNVKHFKPGISGWKAEGGKVE